RRGTAWIRAGAKVSDAGKVVSPIGEVERFRNAFRPNRWSDSERAADAHAQTEKVAADAGISGNELSIANRPAGRALNGGDTGCNVERQRRMPLDHVAHLKSVCQELPGSLPLVHRGVHRTRRHQPMALIVVGPSPVFIDVERIDR